jgi:hypothetical protein
VRSATPTVICKVAATLQEPRGADTVLTGPLDRSAVYGVLAEVEALGLDLVEVRQLRHSTNHENHVTAAHHDRR